MRQSRRWDELEAPPDFDMSKWSEGLPASKLGFTVVTISGRNTRPQFRPDEDSA